MHARVLFTELTEFQMTKKITNDIPMLGTLIDCGSDVWCNFFLQIFIPANTRPIRRSVSLGSANKISRLPTVILKFELLFHTKKVRMRFNLGTKYCVPSFFD